MTEVTIQRITLHTVLFGAVLAVVGLWTSGPWRAVSVLAATSLVVANWLILRWIVRKVTEGSMRKRARLMLLLVFKMGALFAIAWHLLRQEWVEPIGFLMGIGSLVLASFSGSFSTMLGAAAGRK